MSQDDTKLGRFGHHPDPVIDYCVEVDELHSIVIDAGLGLRPWAELGNRIEKAMCFIVGGDLNAIRAKAFLREMAQRIPNDA